MITPTSSTGRLSRLATDVSSEASFVADPNDARCNALRHGVGGQARAAVDTAVRNTRLTQALCNHSVLPVQEVRAARQQAQFSPTRSHTQLPLSSASHSELPS